MSSPEDTTGAIGAPAGGDQMPQALGVVMDVAWHNWTSHVQKATYDKEIRTHIVQYIVYIYIYTITYTMHVYRQ